MQWIALLLNLVVLSYQEVTIHLLEFGTFQNYWKSYQNRVILIMKVRLDANHNLTNKFWIWKPKSAWRAIKNPITKPNPTMRTTPIPSSDLTTRILNLIIFRNLFGRWKWRWKCWWWSTRTIKRLKVNSLLRIAYESYFYNFNIKVDITRFVRRWSLQWRWCCGLFQGPIRKWTGMYVWHAYFMLR